MLEKLGKEAALVSFSPVTGRKHQIRVHAANVLGAPIVGDHKYGVGVPERMRVLWPQKETDPGMCLHARSLYLRHPTVAEKWVLLKAPLPRDFHGVLRLLGFKQLDSLDAQDAGAQKRQPDKEAWKKAQRLKRAVAGKRTAEGLGRRGRRRVPLRPFPTPHPAQARARQAAEQKTKQPLSKSVSFASPFAQSNWSSKKRQSNFSSKNHHRSSKNQSKKKSISI